MAPGLCHRTSAEIITRTHATAVPSNTVRNSGLITTTLMEFMAAIPSRAGRRARAFITATEKAKKNPAISPQPSAVASVKAKSKLSPVAIKPPADERPTAGIQPTRSARLDARRWVAFLVQILLLQMPVAAVARA